MSSTKLVAFILGAGTNIGSAVAAQLREKGYRVALGSRNPKPTTDDTYFNVKVDVQKRESIEEAFDTVVQKLGPINVVIYNGMSLFPLSLSNTTHAGLTLSVSCFCHSTTDFRRSPHNSSRCIL
jgi:NAD(P)-dependent dehydrogenase (short-subunit alcohol dehydrogenase family)